MRIKESLSGGGVPSPSDEKSPDNLFFPVLNFFYIGGPTVYFNELFSKFQGEREGGRVSNILPGGRVSNC